MNHPRFQVRRCFSCGVRAARPDGICGKCAGLVRTRRPRSHQQPIYRREPDTLRFTNSPRPIEEPDRAVPLYEVTIGRRVYAVVWNGAVR